ncbi:MAG: hypothetical protein HZC36_09660 [Armatimonadetes bacterium]|nr:hypothetical protein [Armatimonadota bacterium]
MGAFEYRQAEELRAAFAKHGVRYLFIGKAGAIILGFPDTTQDVDIFPEKSDENGRRMIAALRELNFELSPEREAEIVRGKDFVELKDGPFDIDLVFAPDGIETFEDAWRKRVESEGFFVCSLDDIIASKRAANRLKDRESIERLEDFRNYMQKRRPRP